MKVWWFFAFIFITGCKDKGSSSSDQVGSAEIFHLFESDKTGIDFVNEAEEQVRIIQQHMKAAQSRQKSYADKRRRPLLFEIGDYVYLKVSPMKGVKRFGMKKKLSPRYVGPYKILE